jgi:hypothetical protein
VSTQRSYSLDVESRKETYSFDKDAAKRGLSPEEYAVRLRDVRWPVDDTSDCLSPEEVEDYCTTKSLPEPRREHLFSCRGCRAVVSAGLPTDQDFKEFVEEVRKLTQGEPSVA